MIASFTRCSGTCFSLGYLLWVLDNKKSIASQKYLSVSYSGKISALSAPPENRSFSKANSPVPMDIQPTFFPVEYILSFQNFSQNRQKNPCVASGNFCHHFLLDFVPLANGVSHQIHSNLMKLMWHKFKLSKQVCL